MTDIFHPATFEEAKDLARKFALFASENGAPCAFEVVQIKKRYEVQVFGTHALFKSHKLLHVEPIPSNDKTQKDMT